MSTIHSPHVSALGGLFAIVIFGVCLELTNTPVTAPSLTWLVLIWLAIGMRYWVSIGVTKAADDALQEWHQFHLLSTALFGLAWGLALWLLPVKENREFLITLVGVIAGLTAAGSTMGPSNKSVTRAWFMPTLALEALYCIRDNTPVGWFGAACLLGLIVLLWLQSGQNHRTTGELLSLRFASEAVATERAQALEEATELGQAKEHFLATMSHEMRTPLHGILGITRLLRTETNTPQVQKKLDLQLKAGEHLLRMINDVLDLSRLHARRMVLRPEPTNLQALAQEVADLTQATIQGKPIKVHVQAQALPANMLWDVDAARLKQILINLAGNAAKFTTEGDVRIVVRAAEKPRKKRNGDTLIFEVYDTGIGISTEDIERIFMPFQQVTTSKQVAGSGGTGLGLSIAVQLCRAMKSKLHCDSQLGVGTRFWFALRLPSVAETAIQSSQNTDLHEPINAALTGRVLVVDDNPVNLLIAKAQIEILGLTCETADCGQSALTWVRHNTCDVVLLDFHMPDMNGDEVAKGIHAICLERRLKPVRIVTMTAAYDGLDNAPQVDGITTSGKLPKPFSEKELFTELKRHLPSITTLDAAVIADQA